MSSHPDLRLGTGAWVVVCDGAKALIFENAGDAEFPDLRMQHAEEQPDLPTRDIGTDAPGRAANSVGSARSAMEQPDYHDQSETQFLADLAGRLDRAVQEGRARELAIVAPPRALGKLRKALSPHVQKAVVAEVDKDLVGLPVKDIEKHLFGEKSLFSRRL
ncbi:MAG: host attachment protein [Rhizobiales bacterium]|nr:host attachment protein [Hyphomicrobiales bacterium]MBN9010359.1 host attachment protein [Hyphomicrobiales bacterium]